MLANKLKSLRVGCNLTQQQIADTINLDRSTYTYYEIGKTQPTIDTLIKLAKIFNVSVDFLLDYSNISNSTVLNDVVPTYQKTREIGDLSSLRDDEQNLLLIYRLLSETNKKEVRKAVKETIEKQNHE
ncbi:MAG: hypothetical protein BGN88_07095 [Clostridiales bacterium 43-6]|nr:MAG: hypothetical protein BGN88_07095 [Clostridiales bacterium 43-6]